ncbi:MAG: carbohydrate porin [Akkermansia sp.]|nr:carbohydrate porin [Akkermansia sp.]
MLRNINAIAMTGLMALPVLAQDEAPAVGDLLQGINMFTPAEGDPSYKVKAFEKFGTEWAVDAAYGLWNTENVPGATRHTNLALIHAQLNQRLIEDNANGGTWLRVEFSGSWGLDRESAQSDTVFADMVGNSTYAHADHMGPHEGVFPEVALMHYFAGKRACIIAGMVNLTNYFDAVSIANDSFAGFTNSGFINSTILPLVDSNAGAVLQVELSRNSYAMVGVSRTGCSAGYNPFNSDFCDGYTVVGEYGRIMADGAVTIRINPFYTSTDVDLDDGKGENRRQNAGLVGSIEYTPCDCLTVYSRAGFAAKQYLSNSAEFSVGANFKLIPSREDDFFGISYGVFKGQTPAENNREHVVEAMYSLQINDYVKVVPHIQYIANPAYSTESDAVIWGVQTVFSF